VRRLFGPFGILLLPAAIAFALLFLAPSLWVAWVSVSEPRLGFDNYVKLFTSAGAMRVFSSTLYFAFWSTVISVAAAYVLAYTICHVGSRSQSLLLLLLVYSLWVSALIRALAWLILLTDQGIFNRLLQDAGLIESPLRLAHSDIGVLIGMVHFLLPVCTLSLVSSFRGIDQVCIRAARGLGAGPVRAFRYVFVPLSIPGVVSATSLTFVLALGFYIVPSLLGGGRRTVVAEFISQEVLEHGNWSLPSAAAIVLVVVTVLAVAVGSRVAGGRRYEVA
jgi:putative spermidine/putrescine transport system permease protein